MTRDWPALLATAAGLFFAAATASGSQQALTSARTAVALVPALPWLAKAQDRPLQRASAATPQQAAMARQARAAALP